MNELCCGYLFVWCFWLYVLIISRTRFRVNPQSIPLYFEMKKKSIKRNIRDFSIFLKRKLSFAMFRLNPKKKIFFANIL